MTRIGYQVVFSDESRFNLSSDDNRVRVWRVHGEHLNPTFTLQRHTAHPAGIMRRHRGSANRQLIPANDPKCVVIHYSEDQLASFKNFVVIHSVFSGVITENQRIASRYSLSLVAKMAFLLSKKKEHLIELAEELGLIVEASLTKPKLKDLIVKSPDYIEDDVKVMIDSIVKDRIRTEEKEEKLRREQREYEEKLRRE
ncbi:hypothetical protein TNCV_1231701 [Trichonephila clavipes]|nr:hypothetical protein TNCV_1231701 [Trichonephila clavipes]